MKHSGYKPWFRYAIEVLRYPVLRVSFTLLMLIIMLPVSIIKPLADIVLEVFSDAKYEVKRVWHWDDEESEG